MSTTNYVTVIGCMENVTRGRTTMN